MIEVNRTELSPDLRSAPSLGDDQVLLRTDHLTKRFPQVLANDNVSFSVRKGEIHCLLGENGAGKTTLAEMLYGVYKPDAGSIYLKGRRIALTSPRDAIAHGIGMVHQHFVLVPPFTVLENIFIGTRSRGLLANMTQAAEKVRALCQDYGIEIDLNAQVWQLCVGEQQWVEILKALYSGVELLILDEPTAALTPQETDKLFAILRKMRADGLSIIFITHKLREVMEVSDRVTVLRKGRVVGTVNTADVTRTDLARMMVGREVVFQIAKESVAPGPPVLEVDDLRAYDDRGVEALRGISLTVHRHEILGLAGVSGNGQRELFDVLTGVRKPVSGRVLLEGEDITGKSPAYIASRGVASVPEDRIHQGLVMDFRVGENLILGLQRRSPFSKGSFLRRNEVRDFAEQLISRFDIATPSPDQTTAVLSGGNLQKVIMARELSQAPKCLIVSQPTRGLDVGATEYVRRQLLQQRDRGTAILLISEDLDEIFNLSTHIAVIFKGQIAGVLDAERATLEDVGMLMAGCEGTL